MNRLYLVGQGDRSYFDLRGMSFIGFSEFDRNSEQPLIHPMLDYSYIFGKPVVGGELGFRVNFTSLSRKDADYDPISTTAFQVIFAIAAISLRGGTNPGQLSAARRARRLHARVGRHDLAEDGHQ